MYRIIKLINDFIMEWGPFLELKKLQSGRNLSKPFQFFRFIAIGFTLIKIYFNGTITWLLG
jgi:hypothetical protein